jgi:hypothetical protein
MPVVKIAPRHDPAAPVTLVIAGKCNGGCLGELRRAIDKARRMQRPVVIDMSEVTLVDRPSLQFLAEQSRENVTLINCPPYIQPWISRDEPA